MKHTFKKLLAAIVAVIFGLIFGSVTGGLAFSSSDTLGIGAGVFFVVSLLTGTLMWRQGFARVRLLERCENLTYDTYIKSNPNHHKNGSVVCNHCGSFKIGARGLMQHTYSREHYCIQCGTTLYYSPEAGRR